MARLRVVHRGTIGGSQTWTHGVDFNTGSGTVPFAQSVLDAWAEQAWTDSKATLYKSSPGVLPFMNTNVTVLGVRVYVSGGAPGDKAYQQGNSSSAAIVGTSGTQHPNQIAVAVSHLTGTLGRRTRGRAYLPLNGVVMDPAGTFQAGQAGAIATAYANWLSLLSTRSIASFTALPCVFSSVGVAAVTPITVIRVDNVADTIRARRDKVVATVNSRATVVTP